VSLGNNLLEDLLGTALFFRRLPALEVLTLEGNPMCREGEGGRDMYRPYCFAFIPKIKYLDYNFVTDADRLAAREGGVPSEKLAEVEDADAAAALALKRERDLAEQLADYVAANLEVIETMVGDMFSDGGSEDQGAWAARLAPLPARPLSSCSPSHSRALSPRLPVHPSRDRADWSRLKTLPSLPHQNLALREMLKPLTDDLRTVGMEKDARIREESAQYAEALAAVVAEADAYAVTAFNEWDAALTAARRARSKAAAAGSGAPLAAAVADLEALKVRCEEIVADVLKRELALHEMVEVRAASRLVRTARAPAETKQPCAPITPPPPFPMQSMLDVLDSSLGELRFAKLAAQDAYFRGVEASEAKYTELLLKEGEALVAGVASGVVTDLDKELGALARDKEALAGALAGAHEARVARILRREGELKQREEKRCMGVVAGARAAEMKRNRERVAEAFALGEAGRARVARAIAGEEGVLLPTQP
jgi:hypothetical protein